MPYTTDDLTAIKTAIIKLASGGTRVSVSFSSQSGSRTIVYKSADLTELRKLESEIEAQLSNATTPRSRTVLTRSRKGL